MLHTESYFVRNQNSVVINPFKKGKYKGFLSFHNILICMTTLW
jgi:hypothetical protein